MSCKEFIEHIEQKVNKGFNRWAVWDFDLKLKTLYDYKRIWGIFGYIGT